MDAIPALRSDLELGRAENGLVDVRDPRLLSVYTVDARSMEVAGYFDGIRTAAEVSRVVGEDFEALDEAAVVEVAEELESLLLLDTPEARDAEPDMRNTSPHALLEAVDRRLRRLPVLPSNSRWNCRACGACCHGLAVELTEAEEARIDAELYQDILAGEDFAVDSFIDPEQPAQRILRQRSENNRACVFLSEDGLCAIHARQGMEAKPDACQIFPYVVVHVPGMPPRMTMRTNCHSMQDTWLDGSSGRDAIPEVRRLLQQHPSQKAPRWVSIFGESTEIASVIERWDEVSRLLESDGVTPTALRYIDRVFLENRARRARRAFGANLLAYLQEEREGPVPVEEGGLWEHFRTLRNPSGALEAMRRGRNPPQATRPVSLFLARQTQLVLHGLGPLNLPDGGVGLVALVLGLEATLHAVGERGRLRTAHRAFMGYTAALLENTAHAWPIIDAVDPGLGASLRDEYRRAMPS